MGVAADYVSRTRIGAYFHSMRESRKLILFIVAIALLLDNMLLTIVGKARNYTFAHCTFNDMTLLRKDKKLGPFLFFVIPSKMRWTSLFHTYS